MMTTSILLAGAMILLSVAKVLILEEIVILSKIHSHLSQHTQDTVIIATNF